VDNGLVEFWSLPEDKIYLDLEKDFKDELFNRAKNYASTWAILGQELGLERNSRGCCKVLESSKEKRFSLRILKKLIAYLETHGEYIDKRTIEQKITVISTKCGSSRKYANSIFEPRIPFNFNTPSGAVVTSALLHDGGINSKLKPHYSNPDDVELRKKVSVAFTDVFGRFVSVKSIPEINEQLYFPTIVGIILVYGLGMQRGRKVVNNPSVPPFIFNSSQSVISAFLRQAFDDEAHVHHTQRNIVLKLAASSNEPPRLLTDLKKLLQGFGIRVSGPQYHDTYRSDDGVKASRWTIGIFGQDNLKGFLKDIGFSCTKKQYRLHTIVNSLKEAHYSLHDKPRIVLEAMNRLQTHYGYITSRDLAIEINRCQSLAKKVIWNMVEEGNLLVKEPRCGSRGAKYSLVTEL